MLKNARGIIRKVLFTADEAWNGTLHGMNRTRSCLMICLPQQSVNSSDMFHLHQLPQAQRGFDELQGYACQVQSGHSSGAYRAKEIDSPGTKTQIACIRFAAGDEPKVALMYGYRASLVSQRL
jgi:hypothetical protein